MSELLTLEQAAQRLQVKPRTIYAWVRAGKIRGLKIGDLWRIDEKDLQAFIEESKRATV